VWWKSRHDRTTAQLETNGVVEVAQIEADSSERIHMIDVLSARVGALENHNADQDVRIEKLVADNAQLAAQNTLLVEQNKLLRRQVVALEDERDTLREEVDTLRHAIQGPVSDALEALEDDEPDTDEI
jgi:cell division protein FtsB